MTLPRLILRDRFYVDERHVDLQKLRKLYEVPTTAKDDCRPGCPLAMARGRYCATCPSRDARVVLWSRVRTPSGRVLIALPAGDHKLVRKLLGEFNLIDQRPNPQMRSGLEWRGKLRDGSLDNKGRKTSDQRHMLREWRRHTADDGDTGGIIISPPRSGKCVVAGTLIRTERGYVPVESMFPQDSLDIERVGRFGVVASMNGNCEIRGIVSKIAKETFRIDLRCGISLSGTPEHPVMAARRGRIDWRRLEELAPGDSVLLPPEPYAETVGGLSDIEAALLGRIMGQADIAALERGSVIIDPKSRDIGIVGVLADFVERGLPESSLGVDEVGLTDWRQRMLSSGTTAWRAFASALMSGDFRDIISIRLVDATLARALQIHLIGAGVPANFESSSVDHPVSRVHVVSTSREYVDFYIRGERSPKAANGLTSAVVAITRETGPTRVYDLMVPSGHSFTTNGVASHNTVLGVAGSLATKSRTFITASKIDWLRQFGKRYGELTNCRELYARGQRPIVLVDPRGWKDGPSHGVHVLKKWGPEVERADVVMSCYHQLLDTERGRERLKKYVDGKFGLFVGDEIHLAGAPCFSRVANRVAVRRRMGLTATPHRKDCIHPDSLLEAKRGRVPVSSLSVGDEVLSYNHETSSTEYRRVTQTHVRDAGPMVQLSTSVGNIRVTPDHEVWSVTRKAYVSVSQLLPGERVLVT